MKGQNIHWEGRGLGVIFPDFHPSSTSPGEEGFMSLFSLAGSIMVSVHDGYFLSVRLILL